MAKTLVDLDIQAKPASATNQILADGAVTDAKVNASAAISFSKLASLSSGNLLVGSTGNVPTSVAITGDVLLSSAGVTSIGSGVIVNADVNASAAIDFSKLASLTSGNLLVGSADNTATSVAVTGDVIISNTGVTAISGGVIVDADINASAAISLSKLAETVIRADGSQAFTSAQSMGGFKLTNLGTPTTGTDAATKAYVDGVATGLDVKASVRCATTAVLAGTMIANNGTPATGERVYNTTNKTITWFAGEGPTTIDGVTLANADRILVKNETATSGPAGGEGRMYNGIYERTSADVWTRAADADNSPSGEVTSGMFSFVEEGTAAASQGWSLTTPNPITLDTTALTFSQFSEAGQIVDGDGLAFSGNTLNIGDAGKGIQVNANDLEFSASEVVSTGLAVGASSWLIKLADTAVTPASYGSASSVATFTVDQQGRLTDAASTQIAIAESQVANLVSDLSGKTDKSTLTATGDLYYASASSTPARLGVGTAGQVLTVAGGLPSWATPAVIPTFVTREAPAGAVNDINTVYTLANTPIAGSEQVYLNGVLQQSAGEDYSISGFTITFVSAPTTGSRILVSYRF